MWVTDGVHEKLVSRDEKPPSGWAKGRKFNSSFKDPVVQRSNAKKWHMKKGTDEYERWKKDAIEKTMRVRDHSKCGTKGDAHHCKREDVKRKISLKTSKPITINGIHYPSKKDACQALGRSYYQISKANDNDRD